MSRTRLFIHPLMWLAAAALLVGCGAARPRDPVDLEASACSTDDLDGLERLVTAAAAQQQQSDFTQASRLYRKAAVVDDDLRPMCPSELTTQACQLWVDGVAAAVMVADYGQIKRSMQGYAACAEGIDDYVAQADERVVIYVGAAMAGLPREARLPSDAHRLVTVVERAQP